MLEEDVAMTFVHACCVALALGLLTGNLLTAHAPVPPARTQAPIVKLIKIRENDLSGFTDTRGNVVIEPQFWRAEIIRPKFSSASDFEDGLAAVEEGFQ